LFCKECLIWLRCFSVRTNALRVRNVLSMLLFEGKIMMAYPKVCCSWAVCPNTPSLPFASAWRPVRNLAFVELFLSRLPKQVIVILVKRNPRDFTGHIVDERIQCLVIWPYR
jgi:hypothetical protein